MSPAATRDPAARVVVTGAGCVTPLGLDSPSNWRAIASGQSGVGTITRFDAEDFSSTMAGEVGGEPDLSQVPPKELRRMDRCVRYALAASIEAMAESGIEVGDSGNRYGVAIGSGIGGLETITANQDALREKGPRRVSAFTIPMSIANMPGGVVSIHHGLRGPNLCHVSACASGAHSIGEAARVIERGDADMMVAGGAEAPIVPVGIAAFASMRALSTRNDDPEGASRPFDRSRDGFVMGEGAGVVVLESLSHARARGATILAELRGYGASADAENLAAPDSQGRGAARAMRAALEDAGVSPEEVGYVNAHATSTPTGDPVEVLALQSVFGESLLRTPVSSTKSMTGHLLGAAGAVEAIFCIRAMSAGILPPTINLDDPDPACRLDHVAGEAREVSVRLSLSNSFGFGGTNASLVLASPGD
ncbi:MAG: beta-ketoacyl-ACP synthase II [Myxococcota bacterium]|nr:beta-ketoacyl-ACP synthase II [Myxococcota bacterium]